MLVASEVVEDDLLFFFLGDAGATAVASAGGAEELASELRRAEVEDLRSFLSARRFSFSARRADLSACLASLAAFFSAASSALRALRSSLESLLAPVEPLEGVCGVEGTDDVSLDAERGEAEGVEFDEVAGMAVDGRREAPSDFVEAVTGKLSEGMDDGAEVGADEARGD